MRIRSIKIENFRVIRHLEFQCGKRINVFIGENGAGKSTFLLALKYLLSWFIARIRNAKGRGMALTDSDISVGANYCLLEIKLEDGTMWRLYKQRSTDRTPPQERTELEILTQNVNAFLVAYEQNKEGLEFPVISSYGVNRAVTDVPVRLSKKHALLPMDVYGDPLENSVNFRTFFEWFREREDIENERLRENGVLREDVQLAAVRRALRIVLPGYDRLRVRRNPRAFIMEKEGLVFHFSQLSDGEKCYITLIADIARKLAMANPSLEDPLLGRGVIMIDEIDLHLHPRWQMEVVSRLRAAFPNCQFFMTTHSPHVVVNIKTFEEEQIIRMEKGRAVEINEQAFGRSVDMVLLDYFGMNSLRNQEVQEHLNRAWKLLGEGKAKSMDFMTELAWLKEHLETSDIELVRLLLEQVRLDKKRES